MYRRESDKEKLRLLTTAELFDNGCLSQTDYIDWYFEWTPVEGAEKYQIYVMKDGALGPVIDAEVEDTYYESSTLGYVADKNLTGWKWKVRAFINGAWGEWTAGATFEVEPLNSDC